jgi:hypothetical protein
MNATMTKMLMAARWLVVLTTGALVLAGNTFSARSATPHSKCEESCAAQCPCCVESSPTESRAPLAPSSSTRSVIAKDFQLVSIFAALLAPQRELTGAILPQFRTQHFPAPTSVFLRHCTFLI